VIVEADQPIGNYWMRMIATEGCSNVTNTDLTAIVRYEGAPLTNPTSTAYIPANQICEDETQLVPIVPRNAGPFSFSSGLDIAIDEDMLQTEGIFSWHVNGSTFLIDWSNPTLLMVDDHDPTYPSQYNVLELNGTESTWVYFVIQSSGEFAINHPVSQRNSHRTDNRFTCMDTTIYSSEQATAPSTHQNTSRR